MGIGVSIFLIAVGAILAFAVDTQLSGLDVKAVGWILLILGVVILLLTLIFWNRRRVVDDTIYGTRAGAHGPLVVEREIAPPVTETVVHRDVYEAPRPVERIVEREVAPPPTERVVRRDGYEDQPPLQ